MKNRAMKLARAFFSVVGIVIASVVGLSLCHRYVSAAFPDPAADLGFLRILNNGAVSWIVGANGDNNLSFIDNATSGKTTMKLFPGANGNGALLIPTMTTAQEKTSIAPAVGAICLNTTTNGICVATAAAIDSYVYGVSSPVGATGVVACH